MFVVVTRIILVVLLIILLRYVLTELIPKAYLTWLGGFFLLGLIIAAFLFPSDQVIEPVWNLLAWPLKPLGLTLVLLGFALKGGTKAVQGALVLTAFLILLITSLPITPIAAYWLTERTERPTFEYDVLTGNPSVTAARFEEVQTIVVLGDTLTPSEPGYRIQSRFSATDDGLSSSFLSRLNEAARLYNLPAIRNNDPLVIVVSGPTTRCVGGEVGEAVFNQLEILGVPRSRVRVETSPRNLRDSAEVVASQERGGDTVLISSVTSIRRASATFAKLGIRVIPRATDLSCFQLQTPGEFPLAITDIIPSVEALALTTRLVEEYLATLYYFLRGWLVDPMSF